MRGPKVDAEASADPEALLASLAAEAAEEETVD
jgi:hypothetical protein